MAEKSVDVWAGLFEPGKRFEKYLEEVYGDDSAPLSEFGSDMDESFYDHDFFESSFQQTPTDDLKLLLQDHSYAECYVNQAVSAFQICKIPVNAVLLMWSDEGYLQINKPKSVSKAGMQLIYIGRFAC